jgi:2-dehydro-3-deoxyphosphooctonate aldolase (KDO 8-P synthase)
VFVETHPNPDKALSDGPNAIALDDLPALVECCLRLRRALEEGPTPQTAYAPAHKETTP